ncbi:serine/threonine-protein kinase [Streptomyces sp. NRRL S-118]|uniref:serine/threonine-protein kinase n=1 Tax=Streptomyces sp. NRRL S-118 TaxID=1463881 RepID=UPI0006939288|nr:serine/threonine-protein kinase [Streptomyces sp. NRRL S-118]
MAREGSAGRLVAGRYRLVDKLGSGGFGHVWKARDEHLRVDVALKEVSLARIGSAPERAERVLRAEREARHAAQLRTHPHVVAVHDVVVEDGVPWMVMELVAGRSLEEAISIDGPLPLSRATEVAEAMLEALRAAHGAGIVHRDVKPANVLLADDGRVLLADFGIAVHPADTALTATGMVIGSVEYIAPERAEGGDGGPASDLFSLGVTLYQAVAGLSPFRRSSVSASLRAVLAHDPAPLENQDVLARLIMRLLDKDPAKRPTAAASLDILRSGGTETQPPVRTARTRRTEGRSVGALLAGGFFVLPGIALSIAVRFQNDADRADPTMSWGAVVALVLFVWGSIQLGFGGLAGWVPKRVALGLGLVTGLAFSVLAVVNVTSWATIAGS